MNYLNYIKENALPKLQQLLATDIKDDIQLISLKKNQFLVEQGKVCQYYYFVIDGILRNYYLKEGIEIITAFTLPNDVATSFRSSVSNQASTEYIQAITDCKIYQMKVYDFDELKIKNPILQEVKEVFVTAYVLLLEERLFSLQFCSAAERYQFLLDNYPHYIQQIPLTYIASYLGITIETLSRIRAKY